MFNNYFMYRYAFLYAYFNRCVNDKDLKSELFYRLSELEIIMDKILGHTVAMDIRNKSLDLVNNHTISEIKSLYIDNCYD